MSHKRNVTLYTTAHRSPDADFPVFAVLKTHLPIHRTINPSVPSFLRHECKINIPTGRLRERRRRAQQFDANVTVKLLTGAGGLDTVLSLPGVKTALGFGDHLRMTVGKRIGSNPLALELLGLIFAEHDNV